MNPDCIDWCRTQVELISSDHNILGILAFASLLGYFVMKTWPKGNEKIKEKIKDSCILLAALLLAGHTIYVLYIL